MDGPVCGNCSTPLPLGSKYCNECGTPVPGARDGAGTAGEVGAAIAVAGRARWSRDVPTDLRHALQIATQGDYEIHHELGRGGMGSVFLAREIGLDRLVAIKVLPPNLMFDEGLIERFKREARMVAKLHHPNIIPVYRVHHSHNLAFYTMHFVPGRSLSDIMSGSRTLSLDEVEKVVLDAAAGLGYAHKRGVIHRDVKPANILIDADGQVHLTDFGIAKALVGNTQLTETGAVIGTPQYMAPEQCEGRMVDGRADQYSLAIVAYQLLVGHPPFESNSVKELIYHHLFTPPRPINTLRPDTPVPVRDAIHKALSKDPADRFDSMENFRMAVQGRGEPVFVRWLDDPAYRGKEAPDRRKGRRASDLPTTKRLADVPWANGLDDVVQMDTSIYRRALGALAVTIVTIGAVAGLALSKGEGLPGWVATPGDGAEPPAEHSLAGAESPPAADVENGATTPSEAEDMSMDATMADDVGSAAAMGPAHLLISGSLPEGARVVIDGREVAAEGQPMELSATTHRVEIAAAGFQPFAHDVFLESGDTVVLSPSLERREPSTPSVKAEPTRRPAARPTDARPELPANVVADLETRIAQGEKLREIEQFEHAALTFGDAATKAMAYLGDYRNEDIVLNIALRALLERGRSLHDVGNYVGAAQVFRQARNLATDWDGRVKRAEALATFADQADQAIARSRTACRLEGQPRCP